MTRLLASLLLSGMLTALAAADAPRPNIVVIMADDMGYSDPGCYGGEIDTPTLDRLAEHGLRFTQFYNASRCCPTRAALMTGLYPHQAGIGRMTFDQGQPGYRGTLSRNAVTMAEVLREAGYRTAMVGKWHLSLTAQRPDNAKWVSHLIDKGDFSDPDTYPVARGFEEHWGTIWGVVDYFDPFSLVHNRTPVKEVPEDFYYTDALNDKAVEYVREFAKGDAPFFLYLAHTAPHWPLQARPEDIKKYEGAYLLDWDRVREIRFRRQRQLGLVEGGWPALTHPMGRPYRWEDDPQQEWDARAMAVHAAMIDRMDQGLGRVIAELERTGRLDNTLVVFLSDNGASPERPELMGPGFDRPSNTRDGREVVYTRDHKTLPGAEDTYAGIGPIWANVANTPFKYWKKEQYEGGIATPFIVHWPAGLTLDGGSLVREPAHVIDIIATAVELAGAEYPSEFQGSKIPPMEGLSLTPLFRGEKLPARTLYWEHFGARAIRRGDWKLVALADRPWELYNMAEDRTETTNLAGERPQTVAELNELWEAWAKRAQVKPAPARR